MTVVVVVLAYLLIGTVVARAVAGRLAWRTAGRLGIGRPGAATWALAFPVGAAAGAVWPVTLAWVLSGLLLPATRGGRRGREPVSPARISRLERELDLG
jgi:hypothetical protein